MSIIERFFAAIAPHTCLGCHREGAILCARCTAKYLTALPFACYRCHEPAEAGRYICAPCAMVSGIDDVWFVTSYSGVPAQLVQALKFSFAREASKVMAVQLAQRLPDLPKGTLVCAAPAVASRVRQRGFDQAVLIAKRVAAEKGLYYTPLLARSGKHRQVGADRIRRLSQMHSEFQARDERLVKGHHVLLIDDVMTTGATLEAAAAVIRRAGAASVSVATFAFSLPGKPKKPAQASTKATPGRTIQSI